jgi:hypothetical protein
MANFTKKEKHRFQQLVLLHRRDGLGVFARLYKGKAIPVQGRRGHERSRRLRFPEVPENRHTKVVTLSVLRTGHLFPSRNIASTHFCYRLSRPRVIQLPKVLCQWKIKITPSGIEPATFRLVAQCLDQMRHRVPPYTAWFRFKIPK